MSRSSDGSASVPIDPAPTAPAHPAARSWVPRAHPLSWATLAVTTLAILMTAVDGGILPAVLPAIQEEFGLNSAQAGLVNTVFFLGLLAGAVVFGIVSDRVGTGYRRTGTWVVAMAIGVIGGALTFGVAGSFIAFLLLRIPMGISRGGSEPVNVALIGEWWPKEHRGFAVGVHHTGFPLGQFLTGALIALVLGVAGWREAFLLIPLLGIPIIVAQLILGRRRNQQRVFEWIDENRLTPPTAELSIRSTGPVWRTVLSTLESRNVRWAMVLIFLFLWAETGAVTFLASDLVSKGMSFGEAAVIAGVSGITGWIGQIVWGTLSDRLGRKFSLLFLVLGWIVSLLAMIFIQGPGTAIAILVFWGIFRNAPFPVVYALLLDSIPRGAGTGMGLLIGVAVGISGAIVAPVQGFVIDQLGYPVHYAILAGVMLLALIPLRQLKETVLRTRS